MPTLRERIDPPLSLPFQSPWPAQDADVLTDCSLRLQALADDLFGLSYMCTILPHQKTGKAQEIRDWIAILADRVRLQSDVVLSLLADF